MVFTAAVEGPSDEAVLRKVLGSIGHKLGQVHGRSGKNEILRNLAGYNYAARFEPWIVLVDLDNESCLLSAKQSWLPNSSALMCLRIAVRELEAWLLADRERFASYFGVSIDLVSLEPDDLADPKLTLINTVRRSRRLAIRSDIVPDPRLGQSVGSAYTTRIIQFVNSKDGWRADAAAEYSPSLRRALAAIRRIQSLNPEENEDSLA